MRARFSAALIPAVFSLSCPTMAATTPVLSGTYIVTIESFCPQHFVSQYNNGPITHTDLGGGPLYAYGGWGDLLVSTGTITFNPSTKMASFAMNAIEGSPMQLQNLGGGSNSTEGTALKATSETGYKGYSNSSVTLSLGDTSYHANFGSFTTGNVAKYVVGSALVSGGCAKKMTASLQ
jgi:hypothetical protein